MPLNFFKKLINDLLKVFGKFNFEIINSQLVLLNFILIFESKKNLIFFIVEEKFVIGGKMLIFNKFKR